MKTTITTLVILTFLLASFSLQAADLKWGPSILMAPPGPRTGDNVNLSAGIIALGGTYTNVRIKVFIGSTAIYNKVHPQLMQNVSIPISANWTATNGSHTIKFKIVSFDSTQTDTNMGNNVLTRDVNISPQITLAGQGGTFVPPDTSHPTARRMPLVKKLPPCIKHQNDTADLKVEVFSVTSQGGNNSQWNFNAQVSNGGPRCVKIAKYRIFQASKMVKNGQIYNPSNPDAFYLKPGDQRTITGSFSVGDLTVTILGAGTPPVWRFKFVIDPDSEIPDSNRSNNTRYDDIVAP